jgi:hypothetical protein
MDSIDSPQPGMYENRVAKGTGSAAAGAPGKGLPGSGLVHSIIEAPPRGWSSALVLARSEEDPSLSPASG